jgi:hypothetical protein
MSLEKDRYWLNNIMEVDHVIEVHEDGTVTEDTEDVYAPEVYTGELFEPDGWSFFTTGYSGQYGYSGPWMHASEFVGGSLAQDILSEPGYYVVIANDAGDEWAVVRKERESDADG